MMIKLPPILPGELDLVDINKKLRQHQIILDWSSVISAPESQLEILLDGIDLGKDADWLGIDGEISDHIANDIANYTSNQENKPKKSRTKKQKATKSTPQIWEQSKLLETQFVPSEGKQTEGQGNLLDVQFLPASNVVIAEAKPALAEENIKPILEATIPTAYKIREELEAAIIADLRGPAGGEDEEVDEDSVSDRYLVGLLAPQHRRISGEKLEKSTPADEIPNDEDNNSREVDSYTPENFDELAITGKGTAEDGSTEVNVPPAETMFPSSLGMTFCVSSTAKKLQITVGWGQYKRTRSETLTKKDDTQKMVWKRQQIRANSPAIPLVEGAINNWIVDPEYPEVYVQGQIRQQSNDDFIVSLFLINGQRESAKLRDETWLFQPELTVESADYQHLDIFLKRHKPRLEGKLDPLIYAEDKAMAMLYRKQVEFAIGHGVSVHAETALETKEKAVKLSTSVIPAYEVPKTSPPQVDEIPELAGLVLDMKELSATPTADFAFKLNPLITAYDHWIQTQAQRISDPTTGLTDYQDEAKTAIEKCHHTLNRIQEGLTLLQTDEKAAEAFRFMNQAMCLQRVHSIYSEQVRQGKTPDFNQIPHPTWFPFQLAFILLNLPSITNLHHPDRSHPQDAVADLLWFPTGGGKTEAYLGLTAYTIGLRRLQGVIAERSGEYGVAVLMRYTLRLLTLQQFQRATTLICACESIRQENEPQWGKEPFRIGLWVGQRTTPNHTDQSEEFCKQERGQYQQSGSGSPHQLTNCPWCGSKINPGKHIKVESVSKGRGRTLIYCGDDLGRCLFTEKQSQGEGLPIVVVDEEIYRRLPSLLIATVDKFAQMPWKGEVQMLFGQVDGYCQRHGFRSSDIEDTDSHRKTTSFPAAKTIPFNQLRPPDLIIQDELHLISGPLGTLVGLYETAVDQLASWEVDGKKVRPKVVASTATIRQAQSQIHNLFLRDLQVFPPQGLDVEDNFFSRQRQPSEINPGRRYLGICATGRRLKAVLIRVYVAILSASQSLYEQHGDLADPWMTLVGYFNSMRELGGMRRLVEDDVRARLAKMDRRGLAKRLRINLEELTSRKDSTQIPDILDRLETTFDPQREAQIKAKRKAKERVDQLEPLDVLLATNMISVGVDVKRLGIMAVTGQPKNTAEYIQATSRVGRTYPGLVLTVYNWARPRDLSHYETFEHYHATFYQHVEALSLTPFAPRAIDRGLAALFVALVRLAGKEFNGNDQAGKIERNHPYVIAAIDAICDRAALVGDAETQKMVKQALESKLDIWLSQAQKSLHGGGILKYQREKRDGLTIELLESAGRSNWQDFTCLNSLRNVEPTVGLIFQDQVPDDDFNRLPQPMKAEAKS
ncbi:DISARM system helicase DrmA [Anabaena cylindrica UHCC 0172]|uniref:DISARM system helicase DrmA n=1 Tax=Anabaena cylindrica TaxID=1165 RepID=UPI002B20BCBC|nr:DISARM system helicase DrmA [Anabaena cylindrica]MEA5551192.1 DISARM system helicase DrmA [Anabaena cylindrica UHCC 0172]